MKATNTHHNFTLLRLLLATLVLVGHFFSLPQVPAEGYYGANFPVDAFFVVSGYLISGSMDRRPGAGGFYIRRLFRIYPLYFMIILIQTVVMLALLPGGLSEHLNGTVKYLAANLVFANFLAYNIDGLLSGLNNPGINPSLWTLKIEMGFYLLFPLLWYATRRFGLRFLIALYLASTAYWLITVETGHLSLAKQLPGQLRFFAVGMALYCYRDYIRISKPLAVIGMVACFILAFIPYPLFIKTLYPMIVGAFVFLFAMRIPALPFASDISYGVYLIHAPLIQLALLMGIYDDSVWFLLALVIITYALAALADRFIERPGIELGRRLQQACARPRAGEYA